MPIFIDDLFSSLKTPLRVYGSDETIEALEKHIFNWEIYPRFSELKNDYGAVLEYISFSPFKKFSIGSIENVAIPVNHQVSTVGFVISENEKQIAFTSDTAETDDFWRYVNGLPGLDALFIECAFPDRMAELAAASHHLTPRKLKTELQKFKHSSDVFVINLKPTFRQEICEELAILNIPNLKVMPPNRIYEL